MWSAPRRRCNAPRKQALNPALGVDPAAALEAMARAQARLDAAETEVTRQSRAGGCMNPNSLSDT